MDKVKVTIEAGIGGNGVVSFRREKFVDRGGPDGGDGGHGGDVILVASRNQNTLASFRYHKVLRAEAGKPGEKRRKHGKSGQHLEVPVPVGTIVSDEDGEQLADLNSDGLRVVIAKGGLGGFGNAHFVSSRRQAPRVAEKGEPGQKITTTFELKMIADVGLVGLPNAGKSTLLGSISHARPEIADYPFTTLHPNLGVVDLDKESSLLFADIPGLIEGASQGKGLGDEFLRHVERTSVLVHLIDIYEDIEKAYATIQNELKNYKVDLSRRPQVVVLNKIDGVEKKIVQEKTKLLRSLVKTRTPVFAISAKNRENLDKLLFALKKTVDKRRTVTLKKAEIKELPVIRLETGDDWQVVGRGKKFSVSGRKIERFAQRTDFDNPDSILRLRDIMRRTGIEQELTRRGIKEGAVIAIGQHKLSW